MAIPIQVNVLFFLCVDPAITCIYTTRPSLFRIRTTSSSLILQTMADQEFEDILREVKEESATLPLALVRAYNKVAAHIAAGKPTRIDVTVDREEVKSSVPQESSESTAAASPSTTLRIVDSKFLPAFLGIVRDTASLIHVTTHGSFRTGGFPSLEESRIGDLYPNLKRLVAAKRTTSYTHIATLGESSPLVSFPNPNGLYPNLTNFSFNATTRGGVEPALYHNLLEFLRNCPRLERVFIGYSERREPNESESDPFKPRKALSLPSLRSFTHETYNDMLPMGILTNVCLPHTCNINLRIMTPRSRADVKTWISRFFPTLRLHSHRKLDKAHSISDLNDVKRVTFTVYNECHGPPPSFYNLYQVSSYAMVRTTFSNDSHEVSLDMVVDLHNCPRLAEKLVEKILYFLGRSKIGRSIETLHFERRPKNPTAQFTCALEGANRIAKSRKNSLKAVFLSVKNEEDKERLEGCKKLIRKLQKNHVEVEMVEENSSTRPPISERNVITER